MFRRREDGAERARQEREAVRAEQRQRYEDVQTFENRRFSVDMRQRQADDDFMRLSGISVLQDTAAGTSRRPLVPMEKENARALAWAKKNPNDPRAKAIVETVLGRQSLTDKVEETKNESRKQPSKGGRSRWPKLQTSLIQSVVGNIPTEGNNAPSANLTSTLPLVPKQDELDEEDRKALEEIQRKTETLSPVDEKGLIRDPQEWQKQEIARYWKEKAAREKAERDSFLSKVGGQ